MCGGVDFSLCYLQCVLVLFTRQFVLMFLQFVLMLFTVCAGVFDSLFWYCLQFVVVVFTVCAINVVYSLC